MRVSGPTRQADGLDLQRANHRTQIGTGANRLSFRAAEVMRIRQVELSYAFHSFNFDDICPGEVELCHVSGRQPMWRERVDGKAVLHDLAVKIGQHGGKLRLSGNLL